MKIDAIPGRTTELSLTPTRTGAFADDAAYRVQCAELYGLDQRAARGTTAATRRRLTS